MLSIVVPVLNEAPQILPFLRHLRARAASAEIIVVDGGSSDATKVLAAGHCDQLLAHQAGRPSQMNAGAQAASGDIFWFLHVDCGGERRPLAPVEDALFAEFRSDGP
jgi:glycosyltransferase involved in cell wall biosynthesis